MLIILFSTFKECSSIIFKDLILLLNFCLFANFLLLLYVEVYLNRFNLRLSFMLNKNIETIQIAK